VLGQANGVIPLATASATIGAQSHLDDGNTTINVITSSEGVTLVGANSGFTLSATGVTATGVTPINYTSNTQTYGIYYCSAASGGNCTTATADSWGFNTYVCPYASCGITPTSLLEVIGPATLSGTGFLIEQNPVFASGSVSINSPTLEIRGYSLNGSGTPQADDWDFQNQFGTGNNPTSTLVISKSRGTSGIQAVQVPELIAVGGIPGVQFTPAGFATYPACSATTKGLIEAVSDSTTNTWGATVSVGGGSDPVLMYCDGTNYTVFAK